MHNMQWLTEHVELDFQYLYLDDKKVNVNAQAISYVGHAYTFHFGRKQKKH